MPRFRKLRLRPLGFSILLGLVLAEIILRIATRSIPTYADVLANALEHPERLYAPYAQLSYNVHDLYANGGLVTLRVSANRFIEPEPHGRYAYHVLFLGGSTTEALYVPEDKRWVALINQPGTIATYNAAQAGANTLDKYFTFRYLTDQGFKFDLVVLATSVNDYTALYSLPKYGFKYRVDSYQQGRAAVFDAEYRADVWTVIRDNVRLISLIDRIIANSRGQAGVRDALVQDYLHAVQGKQVVSLDQCENTAAAVQEYAANARANIKVLADVVKATGAKLLVIDEATSFGAPASGFQVDIRQGLVCSPNTILDSAGSHELFKQIDQAYLQAGQEAGAMTFDLAAAMDGFSSGPDGAVYMYDAVHYTPVGNAKAAHVALVAG